MSSAVWVWVIRRRKNTFNGIVNITHLGLVHNIKAIVYLQYTHYTVHIQVINGAIVAIFSYFFLSKTLLSFNIVRLFFKKRNPPIYSPTSKIRKNLWWKTMRYVLNMMKEQWEASSLEGHHNLCNASLNTSTSHLWSSDIKNVSKWIRMSKCLVLEWSLVNLLNTWWFSPRWVFWHLLFVLLWVWYASTKIQTWLENTNL